LSRVIEEEANGDGSETSAEMNRSESKRRPLAQSHPVRHIGTRARALRRVCLTDVNALTKGKERDKRSCKTSTKKNIEQSLEMAATLRRASLNYFIKSFAQNEKTQKHNRQ